MFYVTGAFGALWTLLWFLIHSDDPRQHRLISPQEVAFIEKHRPVLKARSGSPPYLQILKSTAVWATMWCEFANAWGIFMIITEGPNFMSEVLERDITSVSRSIFPMLKMLLTEPSLQNGILNALPHLVGVAIGQLSGLLADFFLSRNIMSKPVQRKIWETLALGVPGICLALMGYFTEDWVLCITILTIGDGTLFECFKPSIEHCIFCRIWNEKFYLCWTCC